MLFVALGTYAAVVAKDALWTGLTVVAACYVLSPLLVPVSYRVDGQGVERRSWLSARQFPWTRFAGWSVTPNRRVCVLRFAGKGMARWAGGMSLFLPEEPLAAQVLARLAEALGPQAGNQQ